MSGTSSDLALLLRLRARHVRSALARALHLFGTDHVRDRAAGDRLYQLYAGAIFLIAIVATGAAVLNAAAQAGVSLGATAAAASALTVAGPAFVYLAAGLRNLRAPVVKLSHPDRAFVAASGLSLRAVAFDPLGAAALSEQRQRRKLATRRPWFRLPQQQGAPLVVARGLLALARQPEGIPALLMQGFVVLPLGVAALASDSIPLILIWVMVTFSYQHGVREMSRVFRDSMTRRNLRDLLPFDTMTMLLLGSLPAAALTLAATLLSLTVMPEALSAALANASAMPGGIAAFDLAALAAMGGPLAFALGALLGLATLLCSALDFAGESAGTPGGVRIALSAETGTLVLVVVLGLISLAGSLETVVAAAAAFCILAAAFIRRSDAR